MVLALTSFNPNPTTPRGIEIVEKARRHSLSLIRSVSFATEKEIQASLGLGDRTEEPDASCRCFHDAQATIASASCPRGGPT
jgi:hypothetical protein